MSESFLEVHDLSKAFAGVTVVRDVSFAVAAGEVVGLVGPNGCGKSTIVKMLSGFHPPDPGSRIVVAGAEIEPSADRRARGMAFVHQDLGLVADGSVIENTGARPRIPHRATLAHRLVRRAAGG